MAAIMDDEYPVFPAVDMRRTQSSPAIVTIDQPVFLHGDDDDDDHPHRRANSNGCPASPTAYSVLVRLWKQVVFRDIQLSPKLVASLVRHSIAQSLGLRTMATPAHSTNQLV